MLADSTPVPAAAGPGADGVHPVVHMILVPFGVALPFITLLMHYRGLRRGDAVALLLARRWSAVMAVQFAIGIVTGTVLASSSACCGRA